LELPHGGLKQRKRKRIPNRRRIKKLMICPESTEELRAEIV
jgi:hypothetical protein